MKVYMCYCLHLEGNSISTRIYLGKRVSEKRCGEKRNAFCVQYRFSLMFMAFRVIKEKRKNASVSAFQNLYSHIEQSKLSDTGDNDRTHLLPTIIIIK
jgi:hypothetical protein